LVKPTNKVEEKTDMRIDHHSNSVASTIQQLQLDGGLLQACDLAEDRTLSNTIFSALYPQGHLACLNVTSPRMDVFQAVSSGASYQGIRYLPMGSRKSAAKGELYLVDEQTANAIAERFGQCGEALISYFDILVTPCTTIFKEPDLRVALMQHVMPGHFDWRGCIKKSLADRLGLRAATLEQFVMAFAGTQVKGELVVVQDNFFEKEFFDADIALPTKAAKPLPSPLVSSLIGTLQGPALLGFTDIPTSEVTTGCEMLFARMAEHACSSGCNVPIHNALHTLVEQRLKVKSSHAYARQAGNFNPQRIELA
jgi:hypothetical protein